MGKFAGFLKRIKNFTNKVVNVGAKGLKAVKGVWNDVITKPGVSILNTVLPGTKPITDALFTVDNYVNKGIDWVIDKTNNKTDKSSNITNVNEKQKLTDNQPVPTRFNRLMMNHEFKPGQMPGQMYPCRHIYPHRYMPPSVNNQNKF
jgi:hypothetical protein